MNISHGSTLSVVASSSLSFVVMLLSLLWYIALSKSFVSYWLKYLHKVLEVTSICVFLPYLRLLFKLLTKIIRYISNKQFQKSKWGKKNIF